jgi:hypothetical protein
VSTQLRCRWECPVCGRRAIVPASTPRIFCSCGHQQLNGPTAGLGDYVAAGLEKLGITKQRVSRLLGRPCKCRERQRRLNELGRVVGIGRVPAATPPAPPAPPATG